MISILAETRAFGYFVPPGRFLGGTALRWLGFPSHVSILWWHGSPNRVSPHQNTRLGEPGHPADTRLGEPGHGMGIVEAA